jgi:hypothetical protein
MGDVSTVWSQAGVTFDILEVRYHTVTDDLVEVGSVGSVTSECYTPDAINVIFVHSFEAKDVSGETALPDRPGPDWLWPQPGCIVAGRCAEFRTYDQTRRTRIVTRCVAHELGHYLKNTAEHVVNERYLMDPNASETKREISKTEADDVRLSGVYPWKTDP